VKQEIQNDEVKMPTYSSGYYSDIDKLNSVLGLQIREEVNSELVQFDNRKMRFTPIPISDGHMPGVIGMGVKDALYLLEMRGLKPKVRGVGRVVEQSPKKGEKVSRNRVVYIRLQ